MNTKDYTLSIQVISHYINVSESKAIKMANKGSFGPLSKGPRYRTILLSEFEKRFGQLDREKWDKAVLQHQYYLKALKEKKRPK